MTGTLVNFVAIVVGGTVGCLIKKGLPQKIEHMLMSMIGLSVAIIGLNGVIASMFRVNIQTGRISDTGALILLISLATGGAIGEIIDIDKKLEEFGIKIERKIGTAGFAKGFINATLIFCIGAMSVVGALNDGLRGDASVLFVKSAIDCITAVVLASSLGFGVVFAAFIVLLYQGALSMGAVYLSPLLVGDTLDMVCMVGYAIVMCIGTNFLGATKLKTANMLPALFVPMAYNVIDLLKNL